MKRAVFCALLTAILADGTCLAQASGDPKAAWSTSPAAAQQVSGRGAPVPPGAGRGAGRGGHGGPIELGPDDKPAFPDPPAGFNSRRDSVPPGELTMVEYDSKTVGTRRKMLVYTPPGYSTNCKYPVLYLLHGIGGNETEWQRLFRRFQHL